MYSITSMKLILQLLLVGLINLHVKSAMVSCRQKNKHAAGVPFLLRWKMIEDNGELCRKLSSRSQKP